jgi:egghead protein (zeste-white 4 protein)
MWRLRILLKNNDISILTLIVFPAALWLVLAANHVWWSTSSAPPQSGLNQLQLLFSVVWLFPIPVAFVSLLGLMLYRRGYHLYRTKPNTILGSHIYFRLVTRGNNPERVVETVSETIKTLEKYGQRTRSKIPYTIEVVTEKTSPPLAHLFIDHPFSRKITTIEVPPNYRTTNGALYKARALQYALETSSAQPSDWIFHLDDESQIEPLTILGIFAFINEEESKLKVDPDYKPRIGQGTILYHRNIQKNSLYTLADSIRTADDLGRYYFQYLLGICVFGMHGSYILCRNSVEQAENFDFEPRFCITEDAYWGLRAMQRGYRFGHVYGFVHEQSPVKSVDFIKQRRRWFIGISQILFAHDIALRYRIILFVSTTLWSFSGLVIFYTAINILHPVHIPALIGLLTSLGYAAYVAMYILGFYVNMNHARISALQKGIYFIAQVLFMPVFSILEASGSIYGLLHRRLDFYVIKK